VFLGGEDPGSKQIYAYNGVNFAGIKKLDRLRCATKKFNSRDLILPQTEINFTIRGLQAMYSTYNPRYNCSNLLGKILARPEGFEPPTCGFVVSPIHTLRLSIFSQIYDYQYFEAHYQAREYLYFTAFP